MALAALVPLAAAALQSASQQKINSANMAANQQRFQDETNLANTSHQREVMDLRAAGLNPILSAGGSGASVPSLAPYQQENPLSGLTHSAQSIARYMSEQYKEEVKATKLDNVNRGHESDNLKMQWHILNGQETVMQNESTRAFDELEARRTMTDSQLEEYYKNLREGLISSAKDAANRNWRNNLGAISGAVSDAVNSATGVYRASKAGIPEITEKHVYHHR